MDTRSIFGIAATVAALSCGDDQRMPIEDAAPSGPGKSITFVGMSTNDGGALASCEFIARDRGWEPVECAVALNSCPLMDPVPEAPLTARKQCLGLCQPDTSPTTATGCCHHGATGLESDKPFADGCVSVKFLHCAYCEGLPSP